MKAAIKKILSEARERLVMNWHSTLLGVCSLGLVVMIHFGVLTMTELLELLGGYHAVRLALKKEVEQ